MATNQQLADAERFFSLIKSSVSQLQNVKNSYSVAVNKYNGLTAPQKTALLSLVNLDQAEVDSIISQLNTITTAVNALPNVNATF